MSGARGIGEMIAAQGAMGALTARIDAGSPLGPVDGWSPVLVSTVRLMLSSQAEIVLFWGPELCALYNEAYAPTIGDKHPRVLGRPAREGWTELWDDLEPLLRSVVEQGQPVHAKDRPFYIERAGGLGEQVFFDINYSPVYESGRLHRRRALHRQRDHQEGDGGKGDARRSRPSLGIGARPLPGR